jgi:dolichol-phosphate mannosyltransferase
MTTPRTAVVVIPTYDEADNIRAVLDEVMLVAPEVDVLVVDDNSPDGTAAIVRRHPDYLSRIFLLNRNEKDGLGAAYRAGFLWGIAREYAVVAQMDADLSHPPDRLPALVAALSGYDVVIGSRYVAGGGIANWSWRRRLVSSAGNAYVRMVLRLPVRDVTAGFKAFRRPALVEIAATESTSNGYCFQVENTWRAIRLGLRVGEIPITFTDRVAGSSKMSGRIVVEALARVLFWRWEDHRAHHHVAA